MYGTSHFVTICVTLFATVLIGVYLCKYHLKYIVISILGLALFSAFLPLSMQGVIIELANIKKEALYLLLKYVLPIVVFCLSTIAVVRWGEQRRSREQNKLAHQPLFHSSIRQLRAKWSAFRHWFTYKENIAVCAIAAAIFALHLLYITNPSTTMGDEHSYVSEANRILHGQPLLLLEHPPLGKWFIAGGIFIFGDNAVGWRIFPIIFGISSIFIFYLICRTLVLRSSIFQPALKNIDPTNSWAGWFQPVTFIPVLAIFLFASDNLSFSQAHVAMLDIFSVTLMLLGFLLYLRGHYLSCGIAMGLSILCKETAVFGILAIILHWVFTRHRELTKELRFIWRTLHLKQLPASEPSDILGMASMLVAILATWFLLLPLLEYVKTPLWGDPFGRIFYIYWHTLIFLPDSTFFPIVSGAFIPSQPWEWFIQPNLQDYNFISHNPHYLVTIGWTIWVLIIPSIAYLVFKVIKSWNKCPDIVKFALFWFIAVYGSLIVSQLSINRPMYTFYFYPAIPAVCLAIAWVIWELWRVAQKRAAVKVAFIVAISAFLVGSAASFIIMSPLGTNLIKLAP